MTNAIERLHPLLRAGHTSWSRTKNLVLVLLGLWIFHFLVVHIFITALNKVTVPVLGFPLGFYLAVQGSLIVFMVMLFWFGRQRGS
jgi:putative solute:sodium symporter small subunit